VQDAPRRNTAGQRLADAYGGCRVRQTNIGRHGLHRARAAHQDLGLELGFQAVGIGDADLSAAERGCWNG